MTEKTGKKLLIVGAGEAGIMVLNEIRAHPGLNYDPIGFVDDDINKQGKNIEDIKVLGKRENLPGIIFHHKVEEVIIAIPSAEGGVIRSTINICQDCKTNFRIVPCLWEIINGNVTLNQIRQVNETDLLGRETVNIETDNIKNFLKGKKVMITGGGGSIGSELCRQIAQNKPDSMIIFSRGENSLYNIGFELNHRFKELDIELVVGNVEDLSKVRNSIKKYQPDIIFHAAAHKHVYFMEQDPEEAIKTNVFGTKNVAESAIMMGVEKFIMISTDKAINPTSMMGASKRVAEMVIQYFSTMQDRTRFMAVRFGNVIGSRGSVVPLFRKQIEYGGPVTVTHPDVMRYFMTIPEAVQLTLQAAALGNGGEVFVLDMGDPIKIIDLARNLIVLSGYVPEKDIKIEFTGLKPGEKLFEEPLSKRENLLATKKDKIFIADLKEVEPLEFEKHLKDLEAIIQDYDKNSLANKLREIVPFYIPSQINNGGMNYE
jgi:FlaA1/EpsC-like NDP-sugar epimerase